MRVGLIADRLDKERTTGVGTYVRGLTAGLASCAPDLDVTLFALPCSRARKLAWATTGRPALAPPRRDLELLHVLVPIMPVPTAMPLVVTVHDLMPLKYPRYFTPRARWLYRRAMEQVRRQARMVIAVSEATRRDIVSILGIPPERIAVAHEGGPLDLARPSAEESAAVLRGLELAAGGYFLFLGELARRKNPLWLVDAFAHLASTRSDLRLVFVGSEGAGAREVHHRVDELGIGEHVRFCGHLPRPSVAALLSAAAGLVLPSEDEGFGIPAVEAMAAGTPLIVSDRGALPEVTAGAARVVAFGDVSALAAAMREVLDDGAAAESMRSHGRLRAAVFSWRLHAELVVEAYEEALAWAS